MLNEDNFDMIVPHSVRDNVSEISENEFACVFDFAASPEESILRQQALRAGVY